MDLFNLGEAHANKGNPVKASGLDITEVADGFMIHEPQKDRVHYLNHTGVLVLEMCTGRNSPGAIAEALKETYGLDRVPEQEVLQILNTMRDEELISGWAAETEPSSTTARTTA